MDADNSALGRVVNETAVGGQPLVTRNFAQIASLSPGVIAGVSNAGELGLGGTALSQINKSNDGTFVHGARSYDNNWQQDGISVSDIQGNGAGSGGIPVPNPDSIQEFKLQTGLYDAAYGRYAGAKTDGSNITTEALAFLNFKLPNGTFLIPTPQTVDHSRPFANQGFSVFTEPCHFNEDRFLTNIDYLVSPKGKIAGRFFFSAGSQTVAFPENFYNPTPNIPRFSCPGIADHRVFSLAYTYTVSNTLLNETRVGYLWTKSRTESTAPFKWSDVG